jgi:hypothetical protein
MTISDSSTKPVTSERTVAQVDQIANLKLPLKAMFIRLSFHALLSTQELLLQHGGELLSVAEPLLQIWHGAGIEVKNTKVARRLAVQYMEGRMAQGRVIHCIVLELYQQKPVEPFAWRRMHNASQIHFQALVQPLSLLIHLQMVRRTHDHLRIRELEQLLPQATHENAVVVRDDSLRQPVQAIHLIEI